MVAQPRVRVNAAELRTHSKMAKMVDFMLRVFRRNF